jgi:hypothetical protein
VKAAVVEEEHAVGDVADVGDLVGRDDERPGSVVLANDDWPRCVAAREQRVVDEQETVGVRAALVELSRIDEDGSEGELDRSRVGATEAGEAVQQRRGSRAARAEHGETLPSLDVEAEPTQDPRAGRTSGDPGSVALPEGAGAQGVRHGRTVHDRRRGSVTDIAPPG